ncbi:MAG: alpha amylase C-terminal domain-containing protein [Bacteroidales bacterium]|nr:alpha amylase C-terminal domain-containing protein [Bacteroidales bacterium]MCF8457654.1 alpha amylase C-terminal domain-containing protein [Bacteroidales bacterium]
MKAQNKIEKLPIVINDPWLEPVAREVFERNQRFRDRLQEIEKEHGSLSKFADAYKNLGINSDSKKKAWVYREWAPKAQSLFLTGDFNDWDPESHPLQQGDDGIWEIILDKKEYKDKLVHGSKFKVLVHSDAGSHYRIPAYSTKLIQDNESKDFAAQFWNPKKFNWEGDKFDFGQHGELLIYEAHIGMAQEKEDVGTYNEFTENILPRIKKAGYNTIQLMAIAEHPYYGSFGYHVSNFFAPSSRFGTPEDLMELVKQAHKMGLAVIMDVVHSHTVKNINEGLNLFDGSGDQYFHCGQRGEHPSWDSMLFNYGKTEVLQFLLSNLKYWMSEFNFDGFRFDGVGSMMYWHHGDDLPMTREKYFNRGVEFDAIVYLQLANKLIHTINKKALSIAEDVTGMPGLCNPIDDGGIGFDYRLGMGIPDYWIKILKERMDEAWNLEEMYYVMLDRKFDTKTIAYAESHDQALVGDKTIAFHLMDKEMYYHMKVGDQHQVIDRGIALHKLIRLFTISLGGEAYMNFIGNEFGHPEWVDFPREGNNWSHHYARRQWSLVDSNQLKYQYMGKWDRAMLDLIKSFNIMSADYPQLLMHDDWHKTIVFKRGELIFVFNFHVNMAVPDYEFYIPEAGTYDMVLNSDNAAFGGFARVDEATAFQSIFNKEKNINVLKIYNINRAVQVFRKRV